MVKKNIVLLIVLAMLISIFAMGCTNKNEEKTDSKAGENTVEKKEDSDKSEEIIEDNEEDDAVNTSLIREEWPTDVMDGIPQPPGIITYVATPTGITQIRLGSVKQKDAVNLVDEVKALGFVVEPNEMITEKRVIYIGKHDDDDDDERKITISWSKDDKDLDIIYESN